MIVDPTKDKIPERPRLIFFGTPDFAVPVLKSLIHHGHEILAVVTQPDRPKGRGRKVAPSPVKQLAMEHHIEVLQPKKASDHSFCDQVGEKSPDLIIVVAFGQILKQNLLNSSKWGAINIHASLLPKYRGAAPIQWAIINNESKTGLTVMEMDEGMDTGPILLQAELPIVQDETAGHLHDRLAQLSGDLIIRALEALSKGEIGGEPQEESLATYAPKIERRHMLIDWGQPARNISALVRALDPRPGAYTILGGKEIKLFSSKVVEESQADRMPGRMVSNRRERLRIETGDGAVEIGEIQYPGKKRLPTPDFLRGFPLPEGTVFGE